MPIRAIRFFLWGPPLPRAQEHRATLPGRVFDPQGAVSPATKVSVTNQADEATSATVSRQDGVHSIPFLSSGQYTIPAELAGSTRYVRESLQLSTGVPLWTTKVFNSRSIWLGAQLVW
jgi:hypothetical protein